MSIDGFFAWQQRRISLYGVSGYFGPVTLPLRAHSMRHDTDRVAADVLRQLGQQKALSKTQASPKRKACGCGRAKHANQDRCQQCKTVGRSMRSKAPRRLELFEECA